MGRIAVAAVVSLWVIPISILVNRIVPDPYMDEIFHIPQAQQYCRCNFRSWDPMITTPPGLYFLSFAYVASLFPAMWSVETAKTLSDVCSTEMLRSTNAVAAVVCAVVIYDLLIQLRPTLGERKSTFYAIVVATYPLHWFFTFLYYTDVASLTAVLAMYLASLKRKYWISAMLGALATLFRQTNIVWMIFVAANGAIAYVEDLYKKDFVQFDNHMMVHKYIDSLTNNRDIPTAPGLRRRKMDKPFDNVQPSTSKESELPLQQSPGFLDEIFDVSLKLWTLKWKVVVTFAPFIVLLLTFIAFVVWNGSIVLGAKEAHLVSPHYAQMMYFGVFSAAALTPVHFSFTQFANLCQSFRNNKILGSFKMLLGLLIGLVVVRFFSIAHPYLLADNRHYTFYVWRKIIQAHWMMKYLLIPLYVYAWFSIISTLWKSQRKIWVLSYVIATALVVVPAPLIEFRYYTIPFFILILHTQIDKVGNWLVIGTLYAIVNIFTLFMFLFRPFHWDHEPGTQRFIW